MAYGSRRYGHRKVESQPLPPAVPTFVCSHCAKIRQLTPKTITLTGAVDNSVVLTGRICETCGKLLEAWLNK